ncbi:MAG: biotin transporter BioY [Oscillospiraceae bacterium]
MKEMKKGIFSLKSMVATAIFAALICVAAPISIPLPGLIPISLSTFVVYLAGAMLGAKRGALAVTVYVLLGAVGVPVFSGYSGGFGILFGVTGGYIIGYIPMALIGGLFADMQSKKHWTIPVGMVLGTVVLYVFGTAWYMIFTGKNLAAALAGCVVPFLAFDAIKIVLATTISAPLKSRVAKFLE